MIDETARGAYERDLPSFLPMWYDKQIGLLKDLRDKKAKIDNDLFEEKRTIIRLEVQLRYLTDETERVDRIHAEKCCSKAHFAALVKKSSAEIKAEEQMRVRQELNRETAQNIKMQLLDSQKKMVEYIRLERNEFVTRITNIEFIVWPELLKREEARKKESEAQRTRKLEQEKLQALTDALARRQADLSKAAEPLRKASRGQTNAEETTKKRKSSGVEEEYRHDFQSKPCEQMNGGNNKRSRPDQDQTGRTEFCAFREHKVLKTRANNCGWCEKVDTENSAEITTFKCKACKYTICSGCFQSAKRWQIYCSYLEKWSK